MNARKNMPRTANGCFMKLSAFMIRQMFFTHMRNIIQRQKMPVNWQRQLGVQNLILYHTEDKNIARRKELYTEEGKKYFSGNLYVPEDLEKIEL